MNTTLKFAELIILVLNMPIFKNYKSYIINVPCRQFKIIFYNEFLSRILVNFYLLINILFVNVACGML